MTSARNTKPSAATRAEEDKDAKVEAGPDTEDEGETVDVPSLDPDVAGHYEEMTDLGAKDRGEGRLP